MASHDVIIVGAGIAGLAAARTLKSFKPLVLEARPDRLGGRAHTMFVGGDDQLPVDLGCSMIHGYNQGNPLKRAFKELDLPPPHVVRGSSTIVVGRGGPLSEGHSAQLLEQARSVAYKRETDRTQLAPEVSIAQKTQNPGSDEALPLTRLAEIGAGIKLEEISAQWSGFAQPYAGTDAFPIGGYKSFIDKLASEVTSAGGRVELGQRVACVTESDDRVEVKTDNQTYTAKYVISTIPLGCMQNQDNGCVFQPELTRSFRAAVERTRVGVLEKAVLSYERAWWPSPETHGQFIILPEASEAEYTDVGTADLRRTVLNVSSFAKIGRQPHATLLVYLSTSLGRASNRREKTETIDKLHQYLASRLAPGAGVPSPNLEQSAVTAWLSDPLSRGATSTPVTTDSVDGVSASPLDFVELGRHHWQGKLGFAGEHTSLHHRGSAAGAWESGVREGQRVLDLLDTASEARL
ncbi:hypothetical protein OIV83_006068 [Microbotryomycetes sp. JL201]|nr:hypothetical protein OIV83_006068 [Microbotryomycetes sp. JL201]